MTSLLKDQDLRVEWDDYSPNHYNESIDRYTLNGIVEDHIQGTELCRIQLDNPDAPFEIIKRIGTESTDAEIYLVKLKGTDFHAVFKIIPYKDEHTEELFLNELTIAGICSDMVKQQVCRFFPMMYTSYRCNNLIFPDSSLLHEISFRYEILKDAFDKLELLLDNPDDLRDSRALKFSLRNTIGFEKDYIKIKSIILETIQAFLKDRNIIADIQIDVKIKGFVIVNELGQMDLNQYISYKKQIKSPILDSEWFDLLDHILNGIKFLQLNNILHDDLHMGNVLLLNKEEGITWLIHDFGKSKILTEWSLEHKKKDILFFIDMLDSTRYKSETVKTLLNQLKSDIEKLGDSDNFMDVVIDRYHVQLEMLQTAKASRRKSKHKRKKGKRSKKVKKF